MNNKIKIIIGLGNPGKQYHYNRHNIGFLILDALADKHNASWQKKGESEYADIEINGEKIVLVKPQTFMNSSGKVIPAFLKQGIKAENLLVVHDELEKSFGNIQFRTGGSHRGHNGLRSIMEFCGPDFVRLRFGIGRPERKEEVAQYVLSNFSEKNSDLEAMIDKSIAMIDDLLRQ
jgi:PTH1 family peptidyl-tRNA hydrolase